MKKLSKEFISGDKNIDELTILIHNKRTPLKYKRYLSELRDVKISRYNSSYFHKYYEYEFKLGKYDSAPIINWDIKSFKINDKHTLHLGSVEHVSFKDKVGYFIYIKDNVGNIIFSDKDNYYKNYLINDNNQLINNNKYKYINSDIPMSETTYGWYHVSSLYNTIPPPQQTYEYIVTEWEKRNDYNWRGMSNGKIGLHNLFKNIENEL